MWPALSSGNSKIACSSFFPKAASPARPIRRSDNIVCVFTVDGTTGEGALYEALNLAGLLELPLLVIIEDNAIAQTTATRETIAGSIEQRFASFALDVHRIAYPTAEEIYDFAR